MRGTAHRRGGAGRTGEAMQKPDQLLGFLEYPSEDQSGGYSP